MNDDMYFTNYLEREDFFKNILPVDIFMEYPISCGGGASRAMGHCFVNNYCLLGDHFSRMDYKKDKVTARILCIIIVEIIGYSWMFFFSMKKRMVSSKITKYWSYAIGFNIPLIPHYLSQTVLNSSDRIMIQRMIGDSQAGIYGVAYSLSMIMLIFNNALMQTISPWMYKKIKTKNEKDIASIAYVALTLIAIVNLLLIALAPEIVAIFAPKSYYEAIYVIPPVAMSVFYLFLYDLFAKFAFYYEKTRFIMAASVGGAILNVLLNFIFIRKYGYIAAGYTTLVCYMTYCMIHFLFMKKVCKQYLLYR